MATPINNINMLPRRQSCDRCHAHKVRCVRVPETSDCGVCLRCKRSNAVCHYSRKLAITYSTIASTDMAVMQAQQKAGRPPLAKSLPSRPEDDGLDPYISPPMSSRSPEGDNPASSSSAMVPSSADLAFPEQAQLFGDRVMPEAVQVTSEDALDRQDQEDWILQYSVADYEGAVDMNSLPQAVPLEDLPSQFSPGTKSPPGDRVTHGIPDVTFLLDPTEAAMEKLSELSIRIYRANSRLRSQKTVSITSTTMNDIFSASCSFVRVVNQVIWSRGNAIPMSVGETRDTENFGLPGTSKLDMGVGLMILASYQRLVAAFESICSSLQGQLRSRLPRGAKEYGADQGLMESPTAQAVMVIKLISHLLGRLDRALGPIGEHIASRPAGNSQQAISSPPCWSDSESLQDAEDFHTTNSPGRSPQSQEVGSLSDRSGRLQGTERAMFDAMQQQKRKLINQIRRVNMLIETTTAM
jgi:hypothetical protein